MPEDTKFPVTRTDSISRLFLALDERVTAFSAFRRAFEAGAWPSAGVGVDELGASSGGKARKPTIECVALTDEAAISDAREALAHHPDARLILVYQNPASFVAAGAIEKGTASALGTWREESQRLLETVRRQRHQIVLVDGHAGLATPSALVGQIAQRLGCELERSLLVDYPETPTVDGVASALADFTIRHDELGGRLIAELEASSLPLPPSYAYTKANVLDIWCQSGEAEGQKAKLQELEQEGDLLLVQLRQVQEELKRYYFVNKDLEEKLRQAQTLSTQREEALTRTVDELARKRKALAAKRKELERKKKQVQDIYRSTSWKLAGPLRKVRRLFSRRARG